MKKLIMQPAPGDRQLRMIRWPGLQYPRFPDYDDLQPNNGNILVLNQREAAKASGFKVVPSLGEPMGATDVTVNWTKEALDLTFVCEDDGVVTGETGHDNIKLWRNDCVYVWLEPEHDHGLENSKKIMIQVTANGFCHDVRDDWSVAGDTVSHSREWGSCFTQGHSYLCSHVVRPDTQSRYRQCLTHKLGSWHRQFGRSGCVGCGRCISWCPTGIDITAEVATLLGGDA